MKILRIVPAIHEGDGPVNTMGTKVVDSDGNEIHGITRIEIEAAADDVWRARIHCMVDVSEVVVESEIMEEGRHLTWWRRILLRLAGFSAERTNMDSEAREWAR